MTVQDGVEEHVAPVSVLQKLLNDKAPSTQDEAKPKRTVYEVGRGRRLIFSALFLLLLPFFASLGPMLYARIAHGAWGGVLGLLVIAACFFVIMFFILTELLFSVRTRVVFKDDSVKLTLPSGNRPTPLFKYATHDLAYRDVERVETFRELYGGALAPIVLKGARVAKKDGTEIILGFVSEANVDPSLPFPEIAGQIADRASVEVADCGCRHHNFPTRVLGLTSKGDQGLMIEDFNLERMTRQHYVVVTALIVGLAALIGIGIFLDLMGVSQ
ncbi:MAG: hypothetical protein ACRBCJ_03910 [Hyphomicrobiaceae bacterium]